MMNTESSSSAFQFQGIPKVSSYTPENLRNQGTLGGSERITAVVDFRGHSLAVDGVSLVFSG